MKLTIILIFILACFQFNATHIIGGNFEVTQTDTNTFDIKLTVFRDCSNPNNAAFDNLINLEIGIFDLLNNTKINVLNPDSFSSQILTFSDPCFTPSICVEEGIYEFNNITIPNNPNGYYIVWERCCRNAGIINIDEPGKTGMSFLIEIPDPALLLQNSSPVFGDYPINAFLCLNSTKTIDFSAMDPDGDSLVYSLVNPTKGNPENGAGGNNPAIFNNLRLPPFDDPFPAPYPLAIWNPGYNLSQILGAGGTLSINTNTGLITASAPNLGLYVLAVKVEEYRNGVKIGELVREIQFEGVNCTGDNLPSYFPFPDTIVFNYNQNNCYDFAAFDPNGNDSVVLSINSDAFPLNASTSLPTPIQFSPDTLYQFSYRNTNTNTIDVVTNEVWNPSSNIFWAYGEVGASFCWTPNICEVFKRESFNIQLDAFSFGCDGADTITKNVTVIVNKSDSSIIVPNVFSPNNDGKNDLFKLVGNHNECYDVVNIQIFNRWGKLVMVSDDPEFKWDGKNTNGKKLKEGTYYVVLQGFYGNQEATKHYPVTIFR